MTNYLELDLKIFRDRRVMAWRKSLTTEIHQSTSLWGLAGPDFINNIMMLCSWRYTFCPRNLLQYPPWCSPHTVPPEPISHPPPLTPTLDALPPSCQAEGLGDARRWSGKIQQLQQEADEKLHQEVPEHRAGESLEGRQLYNQNNGPVKEGRFWVSSPWEDWQWGKQGKTLVQRQWGLRKSRGKELGGPWSC